MAKTSAPTPPAPTKNGTRTASPAAIRPLGDKLLIKRDEAQSRTESGIYLPEKAKDTPKTGAVIAVGTGRLNTETGELIPLSVKKGDRVIFSSYAGTEVKLGGLGSEEELLIMSEDEVLAVID
ncbi:MAG TPA: co-chaperone GroES [Phycisphaerales bacterium]|nr:co-chaperone GroES [Phycisphaerales bacterium]